MTSKNVKEMITEIKDLSVLAVDLAYCSILFADKDLAKEVSFISEKIEALRESMEKSVLMAATSGVKEDELIGILRLASYSERISSVAEELAKTVLKGQIHDVEKSALGEAEEKFIRLKIGREDSGKIILNFGPEKRIWVFAIKRKKSWIHHPKSSQRLETDDLIYGWHKPV